MRRVSSDGGIYPTLADGDYSLLGQCANCKISLTQNSNEWLGNNEEIYEKYNAYSQGSGREERVLQSSSSGFGAPRSRVIQDLLLKVLPKELYSGDWLDFGSGNGAFFVESTNYEQFSNTKFNLYDVSIKSKSVLNNDEFDTTRRFEILLNWNDVNSKKYKFISLIHVFEHLTEPLEVLSHLVNLLDDNGVILIQVPDIAHNEFALIIGDHASHFSLEDLAYLFESLEYEIIYASNEVVFGECTLLFRPGRSEHRKSVIRESRNLSMYPALNLSKRIEDITFCQTFLSRKSKFKALRGVFGTSIASIWTAINLDLNFDFWVDDNMDRQGRNIFGKEVLPRNLIPENAEILLFLGRKKCKSIEMGLRKDFPSLDIFTPESILNL